MKTITEKEFNETAKTEKYYTPDRWEYMKEVCSYLAEKDEKTKVLEIGAFKLPLVPGSALMDIKKYVENTQIHNADSFPYPYKDKEFDVIIILNTIEHLKNKQKVFTELKRIGSEIIVCLPYRWQKCEENHRGISCQLIKTWAKSKTDPLFQKVCGKGGRRRIIQIYKQ